MCGSNSGFYLKSGVAFFDEVRLFDLTDVTYRPLNTATGEPGDGLKVEPEQIGIFDPSYPLKRATQLRHGRRPVRGASAVAR